MNVWRWLPWGAPVLIAFALLAWRENTFRTQLAINDQSSLPTERTVQAQANEQPPAAATIALAFGMSAPGEAAQNVEHLTLKASFVSSLGDSRALLADGTSARSYRVGDRLPDGSVLRRIEYQSVVLWRGGREERLPLVSPSDRLFRLVGEGETRQALQPSIFFQPHTPEVVNR